MAEEGLGNVVVQVRKYIEFARRLLRRWWVVVLFTLLGVGGSVAVAFMMTRIYESRTLITWKESVNQNRIFAQEDGGAREENWLQPRIEQMVSSHTRLWKMAQDLDLYPKERKFLAPEVVLEFLRKAITYATVGSDSFWIAFEYSDPYKAQQGAERLAREFIDQNVGDRLRAATVTQSFMESEVGKVKAALDIIENDLAQFVSDHPEFQVDPATGLPRGNMGRTPSGASQYASVGNPELRRALTRKGQLEAQLQLALNPQPDARLVQAKQDLAMAQRRLQTLRQKYTDQHPDVQRARNYLVQMQSGLQNIMQATKVNPAGAQRIRDEIAELDRTIQRLSRTRRAEAPVAKKEVAPSEEGLTQVARLEKRWYQLTRDREINKGKYDQLFEKLTKAKVTASLEKKRAETQFTIVDPANLPTKPVKPSRTKLVIAGSLLGLLLGLALAALLVILDPRIYNEDDLRRACDLPILAQIPKEA